MRLFGTDGVRGVAGHDLTARLALELSQAAARVLNGKVAVVGRDPRISGEFLEAAVVAGLTSQGVDVYRLGVLPTPGVAYLTRALQADFGVVISASHNPAKDNGIKFFGPGGVKLPDVTEDEIEAALNVSESNGPESGDAGATRFGTTRFGATRFGHVIEGSDEHERYVTHLLATLPSPEPLKGMRLVVDCAHGAAYRIAPEVLARAGAEVITIGAEPDGYNINDGCGSTVLGNVAGTVQAFKADAGIAYDGDADRCLAVDADGNPLDGDQILTVLAAELAEEGKLSNRGVVVTVMSNQGFHKAMREADVTVVETPVGDKHVSQAMRDGGYVLGGEQSGHIIMLEHSATGDGILTSLHLLAAVNRRGLSMAEAAAMMTRYPQVLLNVPGDGSRIAGTRTLAAAVDKAKNELGGDGRVLVRPSGTEPKIRLMVQANDAGLAQKIIGQLADAVRLALAEN
jgi:phosphoglucosamine mutase